MNKRGITLFVISGSLPNLLLYSKILPIISSDHIEKVILFRRERWKAFPKTEYIILPKVISFIKPLRIIYEFMQILFYSRKYKPEILNGIYTIPHGLISLIAAKISGTRNITSIIGEEGELKKEGYRLARIYKYLNSLVFRYSTILTTKGTKTTKYLMDLGINKEKIFVLNGAIDTKKFSTTDNPRDIDILFVGKFIPRKGADRFLAIIEEIKVTIPDIQCYMIGDGPLLNHIKDSVLKRNLEKNVKFTGYIENPEEYYQRSKILIMPSRGEGLSTAMVEAMACGCVPIVSNVGNMTEAAIHDYNSLVVDEYKDIESYKCYTLQLLKQSDKLKYLQQNSIITVNENYSVFQQTKIFNTILDQCITAKTMVIK